MSYHGDLGYNAANFKPQGGDVSAFEGTVAFLGDVVFEEGSTLTGFPLPECDYQAPSEATTVATLKEDFNALLQNMRINGIMKKS